MEPFYFFQKTTRMTAADVELCVKAAIVSVLKTKRKNSQIVSKRNVFNGFCPFSFGINSF